MIVSIELAPPDEWLSANKELHYRVRAGRVRTWRTAWELKARSMRLKRPFTYPVHVTYFARFPTDRRRDVGNLYPSAKVALDGIVDAGWIPDDSDKYLIGPDPRRLKPNGPDLLRLVFDDSPHGGMNEQSRFDSQAGQVAQCPGHLRGAGCQHQS